MKSTLLILITLIIAPIFCLSQEIHIKTIDEFYTKQMIEKGTTGNTISLENIKGSPYLDDTFLSGEILTTSNTQYTGVPLRYNIYNDEIEFQGKNKEAYNLEKSTIKSVTINKTTLVYRPYAISEKMGRSYFELLVNGKVKLLKRYQVRFEKEQPAKPYKDPVPAQFKTNSPDFYVAIEEAEARKISGTKDLLSLFPEKQAEISAFIKSKKLKTGKQEDLIQIISFCNNQK